jgi:hypothetical protein
LKKRSVLWVTIPAVVTFPRQSKENLMRKIRIGLCVFISVNAFGAKHRNGIPAAPLPTVVVNAKKIFLTNDGGSHLAYDAFYSDMKQWGKYEIVGSPDEADLIVELAYRVDHGGTHGAQILDPQVTLTIYDPKTKNSLWSEVDHRRLARREKNREKETINSADHLVEDLKVRVSAPQQ